MKRIKKILASLMVAVMVLTAAPLSGFVGLELNLDWFDFTPKASAASGTCGENIRWTFDGETGELVISGTGDMVYNDGDILWDYFASVIEKVTIEDGVTSILRGAFAEGYRNLTSVTIGNSVTDIGPYAFYGCPITSVTIPDSVTTIGAEAFELCENLKSVIIGDGVTTIGEQAFYRCTSLTSVTMGNSVTTIGEEAFAYCVSLKDVALSESLTTIEAMAFAYCMSIKSVTIPAGVISIDEDAFAYCTDLTSVTIEDGVDYIGYAMFGECSSLTSVTIPDSVTDIGPYAFYGCIGLANVTIGEGVTNIGSYAFYGCTALEGFTVSEGNTAYSSDEYGILFNKDKTELIQYPARNQTKDYILPDSVIKIGTGALSGCSSLESITVSENNTVYMTDEYGVLYNKDKTTLLQYPAGSPLASYTIPDSVTSISERAFYNCKNLTNVVIGDGVTSIGNSAFYGCSKITELTIPISVIYNYPDNTFNGCSNIKKVTITKGDGTVPDSSSSSDARKTPWYKSNCPTVVIADGVTDIANYMFYYCDSLKSITIPDSVTSIGYSPFGECDGLENIYYDGDVADWCAINFSDSDSNPMQYVDNFYFNGELFTELVVPDGVTSIGKYAFYRCTGITSVTIPDSVTGIDDYAFAYCNRLTSVTIPDSVTNIRDYAFYNCSGITELTMPISAKIHNSYSYSCSYAFSGCTNIKKIILTVGNGATQNYGTSSYSSNPTYYQNTPWYANNCPTVIIEDGVTGIGEYTFYNCSGLTNIVIPKSVTSIGKNAFSNCTGLKNISYDGTKEDWEKITIGSGNESLTSAIIFTEGNGTCGENLTWVLYDDGKLVISGEGKLEKGDWNQSKVKTVVIPDGVTSIGDGVFADHPLESITIPDSVTSIGDNAFNSCMALTELTMPISAKTYENTFANCTSIEKITLTKGNGAAQNYQPDYDEDNFYGHTPWNVTQCPNVIIAEGVTAIGDWMFCECYNLESIVIPDSVTSIGEEAFGGCEIRNLTIGDGITELNEYMFGGLWYLEHLTIGSGVTKIDRYFLNSCGSLKSITVDKENKYFTSDENGVLFNKDKTELIKYQCGKNADEYEPVDYIIPDGVKVIGEYAFENAYIANVTIPDSVTIIGDHAFSRCYNLTSITIPDSVTTIGDYAFYQCDCLTSITIPDSVKSIGSHAFTYCYSLTSITIPDSVTIIGDHAFSRCYNLTSITIPDSVTTIGDYAFYGCYNLTSITIPDSVVNLGYSTFEQCENLKNVTIGDGVETLEDSVFHACYNLESITIGSGVVEIKDCFYDCISLKAITVSEDNKYFSSDENGILYDKNKTKIIFVPEKSEVANYAITESVTEIDDTLFDNTQIKSITVAENNPVFSSDENGVLFNKDKTVLYYYPRAKAETSYTIPDGVTEIADRAFYNCDNLTQVIISDSVISVGDNAFYGCESLENVYYAGDVTGWCSIRFSDYNSNPMYYADNFYINGELVTELVIPDGVTSIGDYAFYNCTGLTSVTIPDSVTTIGYKAFYGCESLTSITIPDSITELGEDTFYDTGYYNDDNNWDNGVFYIGSYLIKARNVSGDYTIKDGTKYIADNAFEYCRNLTSITIPDSVTTIGDFAFYGFESLTSVTIGNGVTTIGDEAFRCCTGLEKVTIGNGVTYIGDYAFGECVKLAEITIGDGVEFIGRNAFFDTRYYNDDTNWDNGVLYNGVLYIGNYLIKARNVSGDYTVKDGTRVIADYAFDDCYKITDITIPASVISIGDMAFFECLNIKKITVDPANPAFVTDESGILYDKEKTTIYAVPLGSTLGNVTIPTSVNNGSAALWFNSTDDHSGPVNIKRFIVEEGNPLYSSDEYGVLFSKDMKTLIRYPSLSEVTHYTVPSTVDTIYPGAFSNCNNLTDIVISEGVQEMYTSFIFCENLRTITIPSTVTEEGSLEFVGCINLEKITVSEENPILSSDGYGALYNKEGTCLVYVPPKSVTNGFVMPDSVQYVEDDAFIDCRDFSLTLSDALKDDGFFMFTSAKEFIAKESNPYITTIDGVLYNKDVTLLYKYPVDSDRQLLVVPETVEEIDYSAFYSFGSAYLLMELMNASFNLSDYNPFCFAEGLTVHTSSEVDNDMFGPAHIYISREDVTAEDIEKINTELKTMVEAFIADSEQELEYYHEDSSGYKVYMAIIEGYRQGFSHYVLCDGDHNQLHPVGHEIERVEPGCGVDGYLVGYCEVCDVEFTSVLKAEEHKFEITEILPTCTQTGLNLKKCASCGYEEYNEIVPATGHDHQVTETPADCTVAGKMVYTCHCGDTYTVAVPATGHDIDYYCVESTCEVKGYECYKCTVCGKEFQRTDFELAEHTPGEWVSVKDADCTEEGLKEKHCTVCGELVETQVVPATGHSCDSETIKEPTCSEEGLIRNTCSVCGDVSDVVIPATGEHELQAIRKEPTCIKVGTEQYMCKHCLNMVGDVVILPKIPHAYGEWTVDSAPTATKNGSKSHSCTSCGKAEIAEITATGFYTSEGVTVNFATNVISGLDSGENSLEGYTTLVGDGCTWEYETQNGRLGTDSKAMLKNGDTVAGEYTILIFGDVNGDGWYDGQDAVLVSCLATGMLTKDDVSEAVYTAADCNHDGVIDQLDVDLLNQAGTLLANVDQSKPTEVLLETSSEYVEYLDLIDQSPEIEAEDETDTPDVDVETEETPETDTEDANVDIFEMILNFIKSIFEMLLSYIPMPLK